MHDRISLLELRTLATLAASGSFSAASEILGRDPTSISRRLQSLEDALGIRLADRSTRSFVLTEAGRAYLDRIAPLVEELDAAARDASCLAGGTPRGRLKVALPGSFARRWLDPLILQFMIAHPEVTLDAHYSDGLVDIVGRGFDIAVRSGPLDDSRLIARKVAAGRRLVCASPAYIAARGAPAMPSEVAAHSCLCLTGRRDALRWLFQAEDGGTLAAAPSCYMSSDDPDLLLAAAIGGMGLLHTTDWLAGPHLASGELVEVLTAWPVIDGGAVYVVTPASKGMPNKTRAFSDWVAKGLARAPWNDLPVAATMSTVEAPEPSIFT